MRSHSLYSVMRVYFIFFFRYPPFDGKTEDKIMEKVSKGVYSFDSMEWEEVSKEAKDFIRKLLSFDPSK